MNNQDDNFIEIRDLHKRLGSQDVLRGITLDVRRGERLVIIGGSGSGKSVLLKHLAGLFSADRGSLKIDGVEITNLGERQLAAIRRKLGYLFQDGALFGSLTVWDNIAFPLRETGLKDEKLIDEQVAAALEAVGLGGHGDKLPGDLSGGMRKRVGVARAVVTRPKCIIKNSCILLNICRRCQSNYPRWARHIFKSNKTIARIGVSAHYYLCLGRVMRFH